MHAHTDQVAFTPRPPRPPPPPHGHLRIAALPPERWRRASRPRWAGAPRPPPFEYVRASMMQVTIRANHQNGRDSHVRQIRLLGPPAGAPGGWLGVGGRAGAVPLPRCATMWSSRERRRGGGGKPGDHSPGGTGGCSRCPPAAAAAAGRRHVTSPARGGGETPLEVRCGPRRRGAVRHSPVSRRQPAPARAAAGGGAGSEWRVGVAARTRRRWGVVVAAGAAAVAVAAADGWVPR